MTWKTSTELIALVEAEIFVGNTKEDLGAELQANTFFISIASIGKSQIQQDDLLEFYEALIAKTHICKSRDDFLHMV